MVASLTGCAIASQSRVVYCTKLYYIDDARYPSLLVRTPRAWHDSGARRSARVYLRTTRSCVSVATDMELQQLEVR